MRGRPHKAWTPWGSDDTGLCGLKTGDALARLSKVEGNHATSYPHVVGMDAKWMMMKI